MLEKDKKKSDSYRFFSYIPKREIEDILNSRINSLEKTIIGILYETGCDIKELLLLKAKNIIAITSSNLFSNPKIEEAKIIFNNFEANISLELFEIIKEHIKKENLFEKNFLISTKKKENYSIKRIEQIVEKNFLGKNPKVLKDSYILRNLDKINKKEFFIDRKDTLFKKISNLDNRIKIIVNLILDGLTLDDIKNIKIKDLKKYDSLFKNTFNKNLLKDNLRSENEFLIGSLTRRRIEQLLSTAKLTSKKIEKTRIVEKLISELNSLETNEKEFYEKMIDNRQIVLRHSGTIEVFKW